MNIAAHDTLIKFFGQVVNFNPTQIVVDGLLPLTGVGQMLSDQPNITYELRAQPFARRQCPGLFQVSRQKGPVIQAQCLFSECDTLACCPSSFGLIKQPLKGPGIEPTAVRVQCDSSLL